MANPIPERFRRVLLAVCELYMETYMNQHGANAGVGRRNLNERLRPLSVGYDDLTSGRALYRVHGDIPDMTGQLAPTPNKPHSQWLETMDRVTRRWAHDVYDPHHHNNDTVLNVDINGERRSVGLKPLTLSEI